MSAFHAETSFDLGPAPAGSPRSLLLVSLDGVSASALQLYGGRATLPILADLAREGVRFEAATGTTPASCAAQWALWSGVLPAAHGDVPLLHGSTWTGPTIPEIAARSGYQTAAFVSEEALRDSSCGLKRAFSRYEEPGPDGPRTAPATAQRAADWLQAQAGRPFVAFVQLSDAAYPYTPAPPFDTRYDPAYSGALHGDAASLEPYRKGTATLSGRDRAHIYALYQGEISALQDALQQVVHAAPPETLVVVVADHGQFFGAGTTFDPRQTLFEEVLNVPLVLRGPGLPPGSTVAAPVSLVDLAPTLLDLMGLPVDKGMMGQSRAALARGEPGAVGTPVCYAVTDPWGPTPLFSTRTDARKLVVDQHGGEVFDLYTDPAERDPGLPASGEVEAAQTAYAALIQATQARQTTAPATLLPEGPDCDRLAALGYIRPCAAIP